SGEQVSQTNEKGKKHSRPLSRWVTSSSRVAVSGVQVDPSAKGYPRSGILPIAGPSEPGFSNTENSMPSAIAPARAPAGLRCLPALTETILAAGRQVVKPGGRT